MDISRFLFVLLEIGSQHGYLSGELYVLRVCAKPAVASHFFFFFFFFPFYFFSFYFGFGRVTIPGVRNNFSFLSFCFMHFMGWGIVSSFTL